MKFDRKAKILSLTVAALVALLIISKFYFPSSFFTSVFGIHFNNPSRVDSLVSKNIVYIIFVTAFCLVYVIIRSSSRWAGFAARSKELSAAIASHLNLSTLFWLSMVYLAILLFIAVTHYDLGIDEAWYIYYAKTFASTGMPYYTDAAGRIAAIDNISMLPYYLLGAALFKLGLTDVIHFKLLSALLSILTLGAMYFVITKIYYRSIAIISVLILIAQPGFGFIASTFFGELTQAGFLFLGLYYWLGNESASDDKTVNKKLLVSSLLFAFAIHTKFQLIFILVFTLIFLYLTDKRSGSFRVLVYTLCLTGLLVVIRTIPVLLIDPKLVKNMAIISGLVSSEAPVMSPAFIADKMQLYNRFFPLSVLLVTLSVFYFFMRTQFERFLFIYAAITSFWWIFLYPLSTYRNPFMGLIMLSVIIAILVNKLFIRSKQSKQITVKLVSAIAIFVYMLYGFSANIIYAYIGYNDGVQFDLDGNRNRLFSNFSNVVYDNSQKEFHEELGKMLRPLDTLYNGSFVTSCYLPNPIASLPALKQSLKNGVAGPRYLLITREFYPLGLEKGRKELDSLEAQWSLMYKRGDFEVYKVQK